MSFLDALAQAFVFCLFLCAGISFVIAYVHFLGWLFL